MEELYYNSRGNAELTNRIFELIRTAKSYIKTGNFFFQDSRLNEALVEASNRGVAIFIISNLRGNEERGRKIYKKLKDRVSAETDPHIPHLHNLHRKGMHVHLSNDLHAKFLIADGKQGMVMSANYTGNSLYGNPENGVDITGKELDDLEYLFDILFMNQDIRLGEDNDKYQYTTTSKPIAADKFDAIGSNSKLVFTAKSQKNNLRLCNYKTLYWAIEDTINSAKTTLYIVSWSYKKLEKLPLIQQAIRSAIRRGVRTTILYSDKMEHNKLKETERELEKLVGKDKFSMYCRKFPANHSKCVLTDSKGVLFTANIDGKNGLLEGFEIGCKLNEKQIKKAIERINEILCNGK